MNGLLERAPGMDESPFNDPTDGFGYLGPLALEELTEVRIIDPKDTKDMMMTNATLTNDEPPRGPVIRPDGSVTMMGGGFDGPIEGF